MGQKDVINAINSQGDTTSKTVNNLLSLQDNHVEEFFQYHMKHSSAHLKTNGRCNRKRRSKC